jgi:FemAB-related protein (PEP-CTERM system-associated)
MNPINPTTPINIRIATDNDQPVWDSYVLGNPDAGPYHLYAWKTAVEQAYDHKGYYLMAEDVTDGSCVGVLPLICFKMPWGKKSLISLPYCDYAGPLGGPSVKKALLDKCHDLAQHVSASTIELRCPNDEGELFEGSGFHAHKSSTKVRMLLPLSGSSETLWKGFKSKLRSQIRRPQKEAMSARMGGVELFDDFYSVFIVNMRDLGSPVHAAAWFKVLLSAFNSHAKVGVVYLRTGEPVAAGIILTRGQKACIPWASSLWEYNRLAPNMLLYWTFLEWAAGNAFAEFDLGRSIPGEGTYRFKKQWGAWVKPLSWYQFAGSKAVGRESAEGTHKNNSRIREQAENIWRKMPLPLANSIGGRIRGYISL